MTAKDKRKERTAEKAGPPSKGTLRDYWETICIVLIFVLFARTWVFQNSNIPSGSMENTLLVGDRLLVNSFIYGPTLFKWERALLPIRSIERGNIVVFKFPGNPQVPFIKRVIAKGGDVVEVVDQHVFVNGRLLIEGYTKLPASIKDTYVPPPVLPPAADIPVLPDYLKDPSAFSTEVLPGRVEVSLKAEEGTDLMGRGTFGPYRIPAGHLFVMGDNRTNSEDSRYWGALDEHMVLGRAWVIWWSFKEGDLDYLQNSPGQVARRFFDKVFHFFGKTRWNRILTRPH